MLRGRATTIAVILLFAGLSGCAKNQEIASSDAPEPTGPPIHVRGTVSQVATYVGFEGRPVQGYGVVIGLGENGSSEVPNRIRSYLIEQMYKKKLGFYRHGTGTLHPARILRDMDTAAVLIGGQVPFGAPKGSRFDVEITSLPQTQTTSLEGGHLMPSELRLAIDGKAVPGGPTKVWASAFGDVFVDPFVNPGDTSERVKLREGRIIGGAKITRYRPVRLVLVQPSYALCQRIADRINMRFRDERDNPDPQGDIAYPKNASVIELRIPYGYRSEYERFLRLVLRLPLERGAAELEMRTQELLTEMSQPEASCNELAEVLEAMGRQVVPMLQPYMQSEDPKTRFYTARTAIRLDSPTGAKVLQRFAVSAESELQIPAIEELGKHPDIPGVDETLQPLLSDQDVFVRIAAYEALKNIGDISTVTSRTINKKFTLDVVESDGQPMIYATRRNQAKIVLFGRDIRVRRSVFFSLPDDIVTISNVKSDDGPKLMVYRKVPRADRYSDPLHLDFNAASLVAKLGQPAEIGVNGDVKGLSFTYSQILRILYGMCKTDGIDAKFVLQRSAGIQRIYRGAESLGRPDAPGRQEAPRTTD